MQRAGKALIAEPNLRLAQRIGQEIEALGLSPEYARDGAQALEAISRNGGYALLVADLVLPQVSGAELARRVRKIPEGQSLRIEIISPPVKDPAAVDRLCAELALGPYFKMPFNFGLFRQVTQAYLAKGSPGASAVAQHQETGAPAPAPSPGPVPIPAVRPPSPAMPPRPAPPVASAPVPRPPAPAASAPVPPKAPGGTPLTAPAKPAPEKPAAPVAASPDPSGKSLAWGPGQSLKGFDQLLLHIRKEKFNGRARLEGNGQLKMIEFARGLPVSAVSLHPARPFSERLGQIPGLIAGERGALGVRAGNDETGLTLVQMGAVPWGNLLGERTRLTAEELAECFSWRGGGQASL
ncbi:MAG: hypothetical protein AB1405_12160, partial [Bdellovibrionota bacterium]